MSVYKDTKSNTWKVYYRFTDWQGKVHQSTKRGFPTRREALAWEREQLHKVEADLDMTFESFIDTYTADMKNRLKENTWHCWPFYSTLHPSCHTHQSYAEASRKSSRRSASEHRLGKLPLLP